MARRFSVDAAFRAIDGISKPVGKMQRRIQKFTRRSGVAFDQLNRKIGSFSAKALQTAGAASVGVLSLALADAARKAIEFEQTLVNAAAKFPEGIQKGTKAFRALEKAAKQTGATTEFTASQSAEALNFLAMAGFNAEQSIAALPKVVDLATAAQIDLATATDIATDTLGAFGLAVKDPIQLSKNLARVNDVLAKTVTTANTDMEQLFETIIAGGPVAVSAGASIETYAAFAGKLANAGIKAEKAGTTLKNVFVRLAAQTPEATKALKSLGVETQDQAGNLRDVVDIFEDINKGIQKEKLGTAETAKVLSTIFGKIPLAGVNVLLKTGSDELRKYRKQLEAATGASEKMAAQMRDTLKGQINSLISAFEGLQLTIFSLQGEGFGGLIERATEFIRMLDTWIQKNKELSVSIVNDIIDTVIGVVKILGIVIAAFTAWKIVIFALQAAVIAFNATMLLFKGIAVVVKGVIIALKVAQILWNIAMWLNPIGAVIALIVALVAVGALLLANWDTVSAFFVNMWDDIGAAFSSGIDFVMALIKPFMQVISGVGGLFEKFGIVFGSEKKTDDDEKGSPASGSGQAASPQVVTQAESMRRIVEESRETTSAEVLIRDETGRAELRSGRPAPGIKIAMANSGGR